MKTVTEKEGNEESRRKGMKLKKVTKNQEMRKVTEKEGREERHSKIKCIHRYTILVRCLYRYNSNCICTYHAWVILMYKFCVCLVRYTTYGPSIVLERARCTNCNFECPNYFSADSSSGKRHIPLWAWNGKYANDYLASRMLNHSFAL